MTTDPARLPPEATDDGERIVVAPDGGTRLWATAGAVFALAVGVLLILTGDGVVMSLAGVAASIAGVYLALVQAQRLEFDADAVHRRSMLRPRTVPWSEVTEAKVAERHERTHAAGAARRLGGLTLSMGVGGGRRRRGIRRDQPFVVLGIEHRGAGSELTMELNRSDIVQTEALLATLADRGWLPDDVKVTVDGNR